MTDIETSTLSEEGFVCDSQIGEYDLRVDATGEQGPTANEALVATYASCYLPAFRVGAQQEGVEDLGTVQIDAEADLDDDDDVAAIRFDIHVEADVDDDTLEAIVARGEDICHVHSAVREGLEADITAHGDAF